MLRQNEFSPQTPNLFFFRSILISSYYIHIYACKVFPSFWFFPTKILHASLLPLIPTTCLSVNKILSLYRRPFYSAKCPVQLRVPPGLQFIWHKSSYVGGLKRPEREVAHTFSSNSEVKNVWNYTSSPLYAFTTWVETSLPLKSYVTGNCACWVHELRYFWGKRVNRDGEPLLSSPMCWTVWGLLR
jgi:hypothetical protein